MIFVNLKPRFILTMISSNQLSMMRNFSDKGEVSNKGDIAGFSFPWMIAASTLFVAGVLGILIYFDAQQQALLLLQWLDTMGIWALSLFTLIMALVVILLLPGVMFTVGAGFVFGVVEGSICVVLGTTLGSTIAFLLARYLLGSSARQYVLSHTKLKLFSEELTPHGWKIVMLSRLVPFFPFKLSNYFFGLTPFSLRGFVGGTMIGIIPFSVHNVYLGSIASDITTLGVRPLDRTPIEWALYIVGFLAVLSIALYLNRLARRALSKYTEQEENGDFPCGG
jgi:uncharacterized membrane protein YdjX (TVP38/TMEM64 family)